MLPEYWLQGGSGFFLKGTSGEPFLFPLEDVMTLCHVVHGEARAIDGDGGALPFVVSLFTCLPAAAAVWKT